MFLRGFVYLMPINLSEAKFWKSIKFLHSPKFLEALYFGCALICLRGCDLEWVSLKGRSPLGRRESYVVGTHFQIVVRY